MIRKGNLFELLTTKKLTPSQARLSVLEVCINSNTPVDVNFVSEKIGHKAHLATIYRTLEKFVTAGILEKIDFQEGKFRYEFMHDHHHHAVCNSCGKVEDIEDNGIEAIESNVNRKTGFSVTRHTLELFGLCNKCQRSNHYV